MKESVLGLLTVAGCAAGMAILVGAAFGLLNALSFVAGVRPAWDVLGTIGSWQEAFTLGMVMGARLGIAVGAAKGFRFTEGYGGTARALAGGLSGGIILHAFARIFFLGAAALPWAFGIGALLGALMGGAGPARGEGPRPQPKATT